MTPKVCPVCHGPLRRIHAREAVYLACGACDVAMVEEAPGAAELKALYGQDYYQSWGGGGAVQAPYWQLKRTLFRRLIRRSDPPAAGTRALDIGCATGACLSVFTEMGFEAHGVDINPYAIEQARHRVPAATLWQGAFETRPATMDQYHLVVLSDVIEHVDSPLKLMKAVRAALVPGGKALILTPDLGSVSARLLGGRWPHYKREHLVLYGRTGLRRMLAEAGFRSIQLSAEPKMLSLDYAARQFEAYPLPLVGPSVRLLARLLPQRLRAFPLPLPIGEIVAVAGV